MSSERSALAVFESFAEEYLNFEKTPEKNIFWLDTMQFLCQKLSNPQDFCPSFHVAGSKGKGSISMMIACILEEAGFFTGIYSSPHIINFAERIGTVSGPFQESVYEQSVRELIDHVRSIKRDELPGLRPITWFELVTLLGMLSFKNANVAYSVYEVGLGGRLDATNVIKPVCCCISQIELEHTEYLGNTLEAIAGEKGGIIKEGVPVIVSGQKESVKEVFRKIASEKKAPIVFTDEVLKISNIVYKNRQYSYNESQDVFNNGRFSRILPSMNFTLTSEKFSRPLNISLSLLGDFQARNASVASIAVKTVFPNLDENVIEKGLSHALLPGRFEKANLERTDLDGIEALILDGAHTVKSVGSTMSTFCTLFPSSEKSVTYLLFACAADKDAENMASFFKGKFNHVILTVPGANKEADFPRLKKAFNSVGIEYIPISDCTKAVTYTLEKAAEDNAVVLVIGSFYLVSEVKKTIFARKTVSQKILAKR